MTNPITSIATRAKKTPKGEWQTVTLVSEDGSFPEIDREILMVDAKDHISRRNLASHLEVMKKDDCDGARIWHSGYNEAIDDVIKLLTQNL